MSSEDLTLFFALLAVLVAAPVLLSRLNPLEPGPRMAVCATVLGANLLYLFWRLAFTLPPTFSVEYALGWVFLVIELLALFESLIFWVGMSRSTEGRPPQRADWPSAGQWPRVEIWIPTYKEPIEVLEKSILAARAVDYPNLGVRVLDDGSREWLAERCREWGVEHVTRAQHTHAKAGNLNHAMQSTQAEFIVIMDADFAAYRQFVRRTLPYFSDERLAILQTPQAFYNPDLAQQNLGVGGRVADEQSLFFREIQPARDAWNAAFFCGSCAMLRVQAIRDIGGFPTDSITEDILTTLRLQRRGWTTRYLNERLSMGLAAESIDAFFVQRDRWSRGNIEVLFLPDGPLRNDSLTLVQRLLFLPLHWLVSPFFLLAVMCMPALCLLTGSDALVIDQPADLLLVVVPTVAINILALLWIGRGHYSPVISTALSMLMAVRLSYSALAGLLRPGAVPFKVTPKGSQTRASTDRLLYRLMLCLTLATLVSVVYAGWASQGTPGRESALPWMIFVAAYNLLHFLVALVIVEDRPRLRSEERFRIGQRLPLALQAGATAVHDVAVEDMSASGVRLRWPAGQALPEAAWLEVEGQALPLVLPQRRGPSGDVVWRFGPMPTPARTALIQYLFSGRFDPLVQDRPGLLQALKRTAQAVVQVN